MGKGGRGKGDDGSNNQAASFNITRGYYNLKDKLFGLDQKEEEKKDEKKLHAAIARSFSGLR